MCWCIVALLLFGCGIGGFRVRFIGYSGGVFGGCGDWLTPFFTNKNKYFMSIKTSYLIPSVQARGLHLEANFASGHYFLLLLVYNGILEYFLPPG